jgi:hypothetical protein
MILSSLEYWRDLRKETGEQTPDFHFVDREGNCTMRACSAACKTLFQYSHGCCNSITESDVWVQSPAGEQQYKKKFGQLLASEVGDVGSKPDGVETLKDPGKNKNRICAKDHRPGKAGRAERGARGRDAEPTAPVRGARTAVLDLPDYNMFTNANQSHCWFGLQTWTLGSYACEVGKLTSCLLQITLIWLLVVLRRLFSKQECVITVGICLLWALFVVH